MAGTRPTAMRPVHRPFRGLLSDCQRPQFCLGGRIFRGTSPAQAEGHAALPSRPRNGAAAARANIEI